MKLACPVRPLQPAAATACGAPFAILAPLALFAPLALPLACSSPNNDVPASAAGDGEGGAGGEDGDVPPPAPDLAQCSIADDCVAVSSTCCECPSFAVPAGSDFVDACSQVECEPPVGCPDVQADCVDALCQLVCTAVTTDRVCDHGFERDAFGCLIDVCRTDSPGELYACLTDEDCVQVQADCCGCMQGGADTAVAAARMADYLDSLRCPSEPACPGVDVCDSLLVPRCIAQSCALAPRTDVAGTASALCGVPDLPPCPSGQVCLLNHPAAGPATRIGVGTCHLVM